MSGQEKSLLDSFVTPAFDLFLDIFSERVAEAHPDTNADNIETLKMTFGKLMSHRISRARFIKKCEEILGSDKIALEFIAIMDTEWTERLPDPVKSDKKSENTVWKPEEDRLLLAAIYAYGTKSWATIARRVGNGRSRTDVYHRWHRVLDPRIKKTPWTAFEDDKLNYLVAKHGQSWAKIAKEMGDRSDFQCRYRYKSAASRTTSIAKELLSQTSQAASATNSQKLA